LFFGGGGEKKVKTRRFPPKQLSRQLRCRARARQTSSHIFQKRQSNIFIFLDDDNGVVKQLQNRQWKVWGAIRCLLFFPS
jgi:hypothetical protein